MTTLPNVRRAFIDIPDGQVHVRMIEKVDSTHLPLLMLHQSPASSLTYQEILPYLGVERTVIAIDTPGFGESFRPSAQPSIADYAAWIAQVPTALGYDRFDLFGLFTGAAISSQIAATNVKRVRRLILAGPPVFTPEQQERFVTNAWPMRPVPDGSHLIHEWNRVMTRSMPGLPFDRRADAFNEFYRGGSNAIWGELAVSVFPLKEILPCIATETLIFRAQGIHADCETAAQLVPNARVEDIPHLGYSMLQVVPELVASRISAFLNSPN